MKAENVFAGSYLAEDVQFLLRRVDLAPTLLLERERRIQSGRVHYSEMIGPEDAPSRSQVGLFRAALVLNGTRLAGDLLRLAGMLARSALGGELTIVSIARAGTPVGVVLTRLLRKRLGANRVRHYSMSVSRDRGVDFAALDWIAERHGACSIRFVDGWTGKGTIASQLSRSIGSSIRYARWIDASLWVPLDISASSEHAAGESDYLIPSALLGGTVSGLISRSVLPRGDIGAAKFHGCVELSHLRRYDLSRWFVQYMENLCGIISASRPEPSESPGSSTLSASARQLEAQKFITDLMNEFSMDDRNRVKIGLGESVRVLLRRSPRLVLLRDRDSADAVLVARLSHLRGVPIEYRPGLPQAAVALIADASSVAHAENYPPS